MRSRIVAWLTGVMLLSCTAAPSVAAQVSKQGAEPKCPYGYFDFSPYDCAPYGYYGPEWFQAGTFIGIGPWFHGPKDFHGAVDDHFNPHYGFKGNLPRRGVQRDAQRSLTHIPNFVATDERDGRGRQYDDQSHRQKEH